MIHVEPLYDPRTSTLTYVVYDPETRDAVAIDPVLDYDPKSLEDLVRVDGPRHRRGEGA